MHEESIDRIGAPFWIEALQPNVAEASEFYDQLFDWTAEESSRHPGARILRSKGSRVAGLVPLPTGVPPTWLVHIRVEDVDAMIAEAEGAGGSCLHPSLESSLPGRVAVLADPSGVPFCVNDAPSGGGVEVMGTIDSWSMASLHTPDAQSAQDFYGALFGWELHEVPDAPFSRWSSGEATVGLLSAAGEAPPHWAITIAISDADTTAALAASLGGSVVLEPFDTQSHRSTVIADPAGAVLACSAELAPPDE